MLLKFAFRNVMRNKKRTLLTALAVFFAAFVTSLSQAWTTGMMDMLFSNIVKFQTANIRIATDEFVKRERFFPLDELVYDNEQLIKDIKKIENVETVEERIRFGILLGRGDNTTEAIGMGINLLSNKLEIDKKLIEGGIAKSGMFIGSRLARKLKVKKDDKLLIATITSEGGLNGIKLPIKGIFEYKIGMFDSKFFYIGLADAKKLLKIYEGTTEIFVYTKSLGAMPKVKTEISKLLPEGVSAMDIKEQLGGLYMMFEIAGVMMLFFESLILFLASFIIINTMMMAIFERTKEIGTLKALGMDDRQIFVNFTLEGAIIGAIGGVAGIVIGYIVIFIIAKVGMDFTTVAQGVDFPFPYVMRPIGRFRDAIISLLLSIAVPAIAAMFPARRASKMTPSEALRAR